MSVLDTLQNDMKLAMKAGDPSRLSAIRMLISAIRYAQIDSPAMKDEEMLNVLRKEAKKRREAVEAYTAAGRTEQAESEQQELKLIETYLPVQMSEEEVHSKLVACSEQFAGKNFGEAMRIAMAAVKGQADGGMVSKIVKDILDK